MNISTRRLLTSITREIGSFFFAFPRQKFGCRSRSHTFKDRAKDQDHPGLGENGKFHSKADEHPLPDGTVLTYALVGNQNCGKTTLFNQLTGAKQHVGNFPGVTVDRKSGAVHRCIHAVIHLIEDHAALAGLPDWRCGSV